MREQVLRQKLAYFYQDIHVKVVGMLEFDVIDRTIKIGYESYIEPLRQWLQSTEQPGNNTKDKNS